MKPIDPETFYQTWKSLYFSGFTDLAGVYLLQASHRVGKIIPHSASLELARKFNPIPKDVPIMEHLTGSTTYDPLSSTPNFSRPCLSRSSSPGRLYSLSPEQRSWFRAKYGTTPTALVRLVYFTARQDDPTIVDQAVIESMDSNPNRVSCLHSVTFTWADLLAHASGEDPWAGVPIGPNLTAEKAYQSAKAAKASAKPTQPSAALDLSNLLTQYGIK